jgi:dihydrofolate synthase/folylpolyglutamate synthase
VGGGLAGVEAELARRWPENKLDPSLDRIRDLLHLLGDPHRQYPVVHVAGTNGKTSTARMIDSLLRESGLRTGRMTSPHLDRVTERISLHGLPLDEERFVAAYEEIAGYLTLVDERHPEAPLSFFEVVTALGFAVFADAPVDVAVVEVGLGGTWDATNVVHGEVCVITPIGLDHSDYLGDTLEEIAAEKAGIVKPGSFLVLAQQEVAAAEVVLRRAAEVGATVAREGLEFGVRHRDVAVGGQQLSLQGLATSYDDVVVPLFGAHQAQNAACALAAVEALIARDGLDPDVVRAGFLDARSPGRLEVVRRSPTVLVDAAHNPHGGRALGPQCSTRSPSTGSSGWCRCCPARTRWACSRSSTRSWTTSSSPSTPPRGPCRSTSWPPSPPTCSARTGCRLPPTCPTPSTSRWRWPRRRGPWPAPASWRPGRSSRRRTCAGWSAPGSRRERTLDDRRARARPGDRRMSGDPPATPPASGGARARGLAAAVLVFEAIVVLLAVPVAITVSDVDRGPAIAAGVGLAVACVVVAASLRRPWGYPAGWAVQVATVVSGVVVPVMFVLGGLFAILWLVALRLGPLVAARGAPEAPG